MQLTETYLSNQFALSFELFPPKTDSGERALYGHVERLMRFEPSFITCTYGAGGSTQAKTLKIVTEVKRRFGVSVASHLTCVGATVDQLRDYLHDAAEQKVDSIVALRGDPPAGQSRFRAIEGGLRFANELVQLIRSEFPQFGIAVAGYPETHQEAPSAEVDLQNLARKVDAGANAVITQLFYNNDDFFKFQNRCERQGISAPLVPGLLPVTNLAQVQKITSLCGAHLPIDFVTRLTKNDDPDWQFQVGVEFTAKQAQDLIDQGVPGVHFYVLNKSQATSAVLNKLSLPSADSLQQSTVKDPS